LALKFENTLWKVCYKPKLQKDYRIQVLQQQIEKQVEKRKKRLDEINYY
jgi:hypothetical protein